MLCYYFLTLNIFESIKILQMFDILKILEMFKNL